MAQQRSGQHPSDRLIAGQQDHPVSRLVADQQSLADTCLDAADERDGAAEARDLAARVRDAAATARDLALEQLESWEAGDSAGVGRGAGGASLAVAQPRPAAEQRTRAAQQRAMAASDREAAARDREAAAGDRDISRRERLRAMADREVLAGTVAQAETSHSNAEPRVT